MLKDLVKLATHLDNIGMSKEADHLDAIIKKMAQESTGIEKPENTLLDMINNAISKIMTIKEYFGYDYNPVEQPLSEDDMSSIFGRSSALVEELEGLKENYFERPSRAYINEDDKKYLIAENHAQNYGAINLANSAKDILRKASLFAVNNGRNLPYYFSSIDRELFKASMIADEIANIIHDKFHPFTVGGKDSFRQIGDSPRTQDSDIMRELYQANRERESRFKKKYIGE